MNFRVHWRIQKTRADCLAATPDSKHSAAQLYEEQNLMCRCRTNVWTMHGKCNHVLLFHVKHVASHSDAFLVVMLSTKRTVGRPKSNRTKHCLFTRDFETILIYSNRDKRNRSPCSATLKHSTLLGSRRSEDSTRAIKLLKFILAKVRRSLLISLSEMKSNNGFAPVDSSYPVADRDIAPGP